MSDDPHFPAPPKKGDGAYRSPDPSTPVAPEGTTETAAAHAPSGGGRIVQRAEPPPSQPAVAPGKVPALSTDEIRALLATTEVNRRSGHHKWSKVRKRIVIWVPIGIVDAIVQVAVSSTAATILSVLLSLGAILWTAWPAIAKSDWADGG